MHKGDTLATADTSALDAQISQATYNLASAQIQLTQAQSNLDSAVGDQAIWQAKTQFYNAKNSLATATPEQGQPGGRAGTGDHHRAGGWDRRGRQRDGRRRCALG